LVGANERAAATGRTPALRFLLSLSLSCEAALRFLDGGGCPSGQTETPLDSRLRATHADSLHAWSNASQRAAGLSRRVDRPSPALSGIPGRDDLAEGTCATQARGPHISWQRSRNLVSCSARTLLGRFLAEERKAKDGRQPVSSCPTDEKMEKKKKTRQENSFF
jgi:hypothetical protein